MSGSNSGLEPSDIHAGQPGAEDAATPPTADLNGKRCFVIIPYGKKKDRDGNERDFERVFAEFIKPTMEKLGLRCERSKDAADSGLIHKSMIDQILDWELAIVDITTANENVYYELGIRHTARPNGTIIVRDENTRPPFNIGGMRAMPYSLDPAHIEDAKRALRDAAVAALTYRGVDSLVHQLIPSLNVSRKSRILQHREVSHYKLPQFVAAAGDSTAKKQLQNKRIGMITGDIVYVDDVDVWVNPENTKMEMSRIHDDSVSASIRYHGGRLSRRGTLEQDLIGDMLRKKVGRNAIVEPTTVVITGPGALKKPNGVQKIFHLAAQHGEPGKGYVTVRSIEDCVKSALEEVDKINRAWRIPAALGITRPLRSIIFPLFGTRSRGVDPQSVTDALVEAASSYLRNWPASRIERVYFLAYTSRDKEMCETAFDRLKLVKASDECRPD